MAVEGLTREVIRQRIGRNLMGNDFIVSTATRNAADANSLNDNVRLFGGDNAHNGKWCRSISGNNDGETRMCTDFTQGTLGTDGDGHHDMTFATGFSNAPASGDGYELWMPEYYPPDVDTAINEAINSVIGRFYKREESVALHADRVTARYDLPSEFQMVDRIEYRSSVESVQVHDCQRTFDETTDSDFTQANDTEHAILGQSLKLTVAAGASAGDFITDSIGSIDLSDKTHIEGWIESTVALTAADYKIHLDNGTVLADGSDLESLNLPAVSADTRTFFRIALANRESDNAIISIGIEMDQDKGAHTVWFEDIKAVNNESATWIKLPKQTWYLDEEADDLILKSSGVSTAGYSLLKIRGGSHPAQMTADTDVATVPESYIIAKATALMLNAGSPATREDPDGRRSLGRDWATEAIIEWGKFPPLVDARKVA